MSGPGGPGGEGDLGDFGYTHGEKGTTGSAENPSLSLGHPALASAFGVIGQEGGFGEAGFTPAFASDIPGTGKGIALGTEGLNFSQSATFADMVGRGSDTGQAIGTVGKAVAGILGGFAPNPVSSLMALAMHNAQPPTGGYAPPSSGLSAGQGDPGLPGDFGFGDAASGPAEFPGQPMPEVLPPRAPSEDTKRDRILQAAAPSYTGPPQPAVETGATVKMADILDTWDRTTPSPTDIDALQAIRERLGGVAATAAPVTPPAPITPSAFFTPRTAASRLVEPPRPRLRLPRV